MHSFGLRPDRRPLSVSGSTQTWPLDHRSRSAGQKARSSKMPLSLTENGLTSHSSPWVCGARRGLLERMQTSNRPCALGSLALCGDVRWAGSRLLAPTPVPKCAFCRASETSTLRPRRSGARCHKHQKPQLTIQQRRPEEPLLFPYQRMPGPRFSTETSLVRSAHVGFKAQWTP